MDSPSAVPRRPRGSVTIEEKQRRMKFDQSEQRLREAAAKHRTIRIKDGGPMKKAVIRITQKQLGLLIKGEPLLVNIDSTKGVDRLEIKLDATAVLLQKLQAFMDLTRNPFGFGF